MIAQGVPRVAPIVVHKNKFMFGLRKKKISYEEHRDGLVKLYTSQHRDGRPFMNMVLTEAIRKLKAGCYPTDVEKWVVGCEKAFMNMPMRTVKK